MAVNINSLKRQPSNLDYTHPTQFRFDILKLPNVEYTITSANVPGISMSGDAILNTRFKGVPFMGDTLIYETLNITFIVQEDLANYRELHDWITGIGFPKDNEQFDNALRNEIQTKPGALPVIPKQTSNVRNAPVVNPSVLTSNATMHILSNKNNPKIRVNYRGLYPSSLSGVTYNTQDSTGEGITADVQFQFDLYEFEVL